jgi:hypothetical protein
MRDTGTDIMNQIALFFGKTNDQQKTLTDFKDPENHKNKTLDEKDKHFVEKLGRCSDSELIKLLNGRISEEDRWSLNYLILLPIMRW